MLECSKVDLKKRGWHYKLSTQMCLELLLKAKPCPAEPAKLNRGVDKISKLDILRGTMIVVK